KASRSALRTALLVPFTAGGLESSTNHLFAVSFAAPPIGPEPEPSPAAAGATARPVMQRSVTASRRNLLNFPPVRCQSPADTPLFRYLGSLAISNLMSNKALPLSGAGIESDFLDRLRQENRPPLSSAPGSVDADSVEDS